jgi:saccharopine dehydrogenase-like NADP-dependent oxidoreductase
MKKVIIVGAGAQAGVITGVLAQAADVGEILLTDIDIARARGIAETNGSRKIRAEVIDASDIDAMAERMKAGSFDLVINATIPMFVRQVLQAAYRAGISYLDMASNEIYPKPGIPLEQFEYADAWEKAGLKCLTGAGGDPGLSNIMAKDGVDSMDEVESIEIKDYGEADCDIPVALWSMRTFLEDCFLPATVWKDGKPIEVTPFTGEEMYELPPPFKGAGKFYYHDHEEAATIPLYCGKPVKYCDFKIGEPGIDTWRLLIEGLGLMDENRIDFPGGKVSPREMLFKLIPATSSPRQQIELYESGRLESRLVLICDVKGRSKGQNVEVRLWTESPSGAEACKRLPGTNDVSWMTSIPASVMALMLLRDQVEHVGVFPPEVFNRREMDLFYSGIAEWGITVNKQVKTLAGKEGR